MDTPKVTPRGRSSFAVIVAAPRKHDRIKALQRDVDQLMEANGDLKARLSKLKASLDSMINLATDKVKEVEAKVTQPHAVAIGKV
ncbi:hypothetical protein GOP47_0031164 [Adiantum capillus-veneris]|nr:hypothetical protein GOP47_0031164 [Adiantum capillus-veneris]